MKLINTGITDLLVVDDLPHGARSFDIELNEALELYQLYWLADFMGIRDIRQCRDLPKGYKYTVFGMAAELTEEQWATVLGFHELEHGKLYFNYSGGIFLLKATESGHSLLKANGILLVNPYGPDEPKDIPDLGAFTQARREKWKLWKEAQSKVSNPLILKAEKMQ